eukprot:GFYU01001754.1.p1 GENE.GFYU01001754.1~~GFYU01001754.1.p1  ORF type:complete len:1410 (-),score=360.34 GFYU01001754.1:53-4204(-)
MLEEESNEVTKPRGDEEVKPYKPGVVVSSIFKIPSVNKSAAAAEAQSSGQRPGYDMFGIVYMCDDCNGYIKGLRFRCSECKNFDLCPTCHKEKGHPHFMWEEGEDEFEIRRQIQGSCIAASLANAFHCYAKRLCFGVRLPSSTVTPQPVHALKEKDTSEVVRIRDTVETNVGKTTTAAAVVATPPSDKYTFITYESMWKLIGYISTAMTTVGIRPRAHVATCGHGSFEQFVADFAATRRSMVTVPLSTTYTDSTIVSILKELSVPIIFCSANLLTMYTKAVGELQRLAGESGGDGGVTSLVKYLILLPDVTTMVNLEDVERKATEDVAAWRQAAGDATVEWSDLLPTTTCEDTGVKIAKYEDFLALGHAVYTTDSTDGADVVTCNMDDVLTILYTSGSTGTPKGAMIPDRSENAWMENVGHMTTTLSPRVTIQYEPFSASATRPNLWRDLTLGGRVALAYKFGDGQLYNLFDDIKVAQPSTFIGVPRIWNIIHDCCRTFVNKNYGIALKDFVERERRNACGGSSTQTLTPLLADTDGADSDEEMPDLERVPPPLTDDEVANMCGSMDPFELRRLKYKVSKAVFEDFVDQYFGTRLHHVVTGGAPTTPEVFEWMQACFGAAGVEVYESYGITESGGLSQNKRRLLDLELKLIPFESYTPQDKPYPRGELCVKSARTFLGYVGRPDLTAKVLDDDGFFHTGDICVLVGDSVHLIGRTNNNVKLAQGEFVSFEVIESVLSASPYIEELFVWGDQSKSSTVAVIVPSKHSFTEDEKQDPERCKTIITDSIASLAEEAKLRLFEVPTAVHVDWSSTWSANNGLLTRGGKLSRGNLQLHYEDVIQELYTSVDNGVSGASLSVMELVEQVLQLGDEDAGVDEDADFFDLGGDSVTVMQLRKLLEEKCGVHIPPTVMFEKSTIRSLAEYIQCQLSLQQTTMQRSADGASALRAVLGGPPDGDFMDAATSGLKSSKRFKPEIDTYAGGTNWLEVANARIEEMKFFDEPSLDDVTKPAKCHNVFLTGCTGFVGSFLLAELLSKLPSHVKIHCLVRVPDPHVDGAADRARERVANKLLDICRWDDAYADRILAVVGDLGQPQMGIADGEWETLCNTIDVIYHCGARVSSFGTYKSMQRANVDGTAEALRLGWTVRKKTFHFISTMSVFTAYATTSDVSETQLPFPPNQTRPTAGYSQTKWVAECLVKHGKALGMKTCIYRLGLMGPDTVTGASNKDDWFIRFVAACVKLQSWPEPAGQCVEINPVDMAMRNLVALSLDDNQHFFKVPAYHIIDSKMYSLDTFEDLLGKVQLLPKRLATLRLFEWLPSAEQLDLFGILSKMFTYGFPKIDQFDADVTTAQLDSLRIKPWRHDDNMESYVHRIVEYMIARPEEFGL